MAGKLFPYDVVIVGPNCGIDSYYVLKELQLTGVNRAQSTFHTAGGKGNNMARALVHLGGRALSLGIVGGLAGQFITKELDREGIGYDFAWSEVESRRMSTLLVEGLPDTTVILEPGKPVGEKAHQHLVEAILRHQHDAPFVVFIGSLPPDLPVDFCAQMITRLKQNNVKVAIDLAGPALTRAAEVIPAIMKVNRQEFFAALGPDADRNSLNWPGQHYYEKQQDAGLELLIITDGARGAYVFSGEFRPFWVKTAVESFTSSAGAGDTFLAGFLLMRAKGKSIREAACFASAAAAANIQQLGCGFLDKSLVPYFLTKTTVEEQVNFEVGNVRCPPPEF